MRNFLAATATACLLLSGCASDPVSADISFGGSLTPPPAMASSGPDSARDGIYVGTANVEVNTFQGCRSPMSITNFQVDGNTIRFGGFNATVASDGSVPMTLFRGMYFAGRFDGTKFIGHIDTSGDPMRMFRGCTYAISVVRQTG
jgi:hypothetical protein